MAVGSGWQPVGAAVIRLEQEVLLGAAAMSMRSIDATSYTIMGWPRVISRPLTRSVHALLGVLGDPAAPGAATGTRYPLLLEL